MTKPRVAVLCGGKSSESAISKATGNAVANALRCAGFPVQQIDPSGEFLADLDQFGADVAFIALHGEFGEDGQVQQILETKGIPYTSSGVHASQLAMDKVLAKQEFTRAGVRTPDYRVLRPPFAQEALNEAVLALGLPLIVKPVAEGSSLGVSLLRSVDGWPEALTLASARGNAVLAEQYIAGRELTVAVMEGTALPIIELSYETDFFDYRAKYTKGITTYNESPRLDPGIAAAVKDAAVRAYNCLCCRGVARVDMMLSAEGLPYVLEVNTIPGMTTTSLVPKAARRAGVEFDQLVSMMVDMGLAAHEQAKEASIGKARKASA
jgi:D-alanine-D-alanine ligase